MVKAVLVFIDIIERPPSSPFDFLFSNNNVTTYLHTPVNQKLCYQNNPEIIFNNDIGSIF
jgi:hypothetical protein